MYRYLCHLLCCLPLLLAAGRLQASPVDSDGAQCVAQNRLLSLSTEQGTHPAEIIPFDCGTVHFYICPVVPQGYLVVSGDTELPPIMAFSLDNNFGEINLEHNPLLSLLIADLQSRWDNRDLLSEQVRSERAQKWRELLSDGFVPQSQRTDWWPPEGSTPTGGWIETNWTQNHPYNAFCPIDQNSGNRSVAGCPSVAMAQILSYHQTTRNTRFNDWDDYHHNYGGNNFWIDDDHAEYDFLPFPELNSLLDSLEAHWGLEQPLTDDDMGALVFACGVACQQVYNPSGSGTFGVIQAYNAFLRFSFPEIRLLDEDDEDLYPTLMQNMMDALPVHFAVVTPQWDMGHNVVLDGYNSDDYYHMNFGWGGAYNGWYLLPEEIPYGLTVVEGAICDIGWEPTAVAAPLSEVSSFRLNCHPNPCNPATTIHFSLENVGHITLAIYDLQGRLVDRLLNGVMRAGEHDVSWEPAVASGIYFVRLENREVTEVVKICVLK